MTYTREDNVILNHFNIKFPLVLKSEESFSITFNLEGGNQLEFNQGVHYLFGDNGSGKTTFLNMLALIAGPIGKRARRYAGAITFKGEPYNGTHFNHIRAAEIREKHFCIFPQKAFFLPVSSRDNYSVLNGSDEMKMAQFSSQQYPDYLSGGQQQKILMDILLDEKKPVWFLDEPLANLDAERRHYFWKTLDAAYARGLKSVFFIDHWMGEEIMEDNDFQHTNTILVSMRYHQKNIVTETESRYIQIYKNTSPQNFFLKQKTKR